MVKKNLNILAGILLLLGQFFLPGVPSTASEKGPTLQAGAATVAASPKEFPVAVDGYFEPRTFNSIVEPLFTRAIMIQKGEEYFVFATIDAVAAPAKFISDIKEKVRQKTGLDPARICISTTHTHFAPGLRAKTYTDVNAKYIPFLSDCTVQVICKAKENLQPAQFGWTTAREPRHVFCRRFLMKPDEVGWDEPAAFTGVKKNIARMNPPRMSPNIISRTGVPDQTIYILAFQTPDGKPLAILSNYSTHYAGNATAISSDYFGVYARRIKEMLQAPNNFVAMMTNGTSGDTNCIDFLNPNQEKVDYIVVGEHIAEKVRDAYKNIKFSDDVPLHSIQDTLTLKVRKPLPAEVAEAKVFVEANKDNPTVRTTTMSYARRTIDLANVEAERTIPLQAIRIGDFGIGTIPHEVYSFTGHDLRNNVPFNSFMIISLANGSNGYLPTAEQFELGGYNTWRGTSSLEEMAEPKIRTKLLTMLQEINKK